MYLFDVFWKHKEISAAKTKRKIEAEPVVKGIFWLQIWGYVNFTLQIWGYLIFTFKCYMSNLMTPCWIILRSFFLKFQYTQPFFSHADFLTYSPHCSFITLKSITLFCRLIVFGDLCINTSVNLQISQEQTAWIIMLYWPELNIIAAIKQDRINKHQAGTYHCGHLDWSLETLKRTFY